MALKSKPSNCSCTESNLSRVQNIRKTCFRKVINCETTYWLRVISDAGRPVLYQRKCSPDRICIQPQMWNTVVDLRNIINTRHIIVSSDVATAMPANIVATFNIRTDKHCLSIILIMLPEMAMRSFPAYLLVHQRNCPSIRCVHKLSIGRSGHQSLTPNRPPIL